MRTFIGHVVWGAMCLILSTSVRAKPFSIGAEDEKALLSQLMKKPPELRNLAKDESDKFVQLAQTQNGDLVILAALALAYSDEADAKAALSALGSNRSPVVSGAAWCSMAVQENRGKDAATCLHNLSFRLEKSNRPFERMFLANRLWVDHGQRAIPALMNAAKVESDVDVRFEVLGYLAQCNSRELDAQILSWKWDEKARKAMVPESLQFLMNLLTPGRSIGPSFLFCEQLLDELKRRNSQQGRNDSGKTASAASKSSIQPPSHRGNFCGPETIAVDSDLRDKLMRINPIMTEGEPCGERGPETLNDADQLLRQHVSMACFPARCVEYKGVFYFSGGTSAGPIYDFSSGFAFRRGEAKLYRWSLPEHDAKTEVLSLAQETSFGKMFGRVKTWEKLPVRDRLLILNELAARLRDETPTPVTDPEDMAVFSRIGESFNGDVPGTVLQQDVYMMGGRMAWAIESILGDKRLPAIAEKQTKEERLAACRKINAAILAYRREAEYSAVDGVRKRGSLAASPGGGLRCLAAAISGACSLALMGYVVLKLRGCKGRRSPIEPPR